MSDEPNGADISENHVRQKLSMLVHATETIVDRNIAQIGTMPFVDQRMLSIASMQFTLGFLAWQRALAAAVQPAPAPQPEQQQQEQ